MKRIGVTGASGFIGKALVAALAARGDLVRAFVRDVSRAAFPAAVQVRQLDFAAAAIGDISASIEGLDAIVHLAGETVAGRWTEKKKRQIHDSRELTTRNLVTAMWQSPQPPRVLVCASAAGYYGSRGDQPLAEDAAPGDDFLAHVTIDWEREAEVAQEFGTRVVRMRQGIVLGRGGGALEAMKRPFRAGVGGPLGSGRQWVPWIHLHDDVSLYIFALDREDVEGPLNAVAPDPSTNARLSQALGFALRRPSLLKAPAAALRLILGEFADSVLSSQLMLPARAEDLGFTWKFASLEEALLDLVDPGSDRAPAVQVFKTSTALRAEPPHAFNFFSNPENLALLEPPRLRLALRSPQPIVMQRGTVIEYDVRIRGIPMRWKTLITRWKPPDMFEDVALRGPFLVWKHLHEFEAVAGATNVTDSVTYALGLAPLSNMALKMVRKDLERIFDYRRSQIMKLEAVDADGREVG